MSASTELYQKFGCSGIVFINTTTERTGRFCALQVLADTVISSITAKESLLGGDTITGVTIPAGTVIYLPFSAITLTSGTAIAYNMALPLSEGNALLP